VKAATSRKGYDFKTVSAIAKNPAPALKRADECAIRRVRADLFAHSFGRIRIRRRRGYPDSDRAAAIRIPAAGHGTVTPCRVTPEVFTVGSSSVCTLTVDGGIVSITTGTLAGFTEQIAGGADSAATAAEQTPNV
jgi:hypothetical protein